MYKYLCIPSFSEERRVNIATPLTAVCTTILDLIIHCLPCAFFHSPFGTILWTHVAAAETTDSPAVGAER